MTVQVQIPQIPQIPPIPPIPTLPQPPIPPEIVQIGSAPPDAVLVAVVAVVGIIVAGIVLYPLLRAFARRIEGRTSRPGLESEVDQLRARMAELEQVHQRMTELEDRVDFSERLLSQGREAVVERKSPIP